MSKITGPVLNLFLPAKQLFLFVFGRARGSVRRVIISVMAERKWIVLFSDLRFRGIFAVFSIT